MKSETESHSVMSNSLWPHELQLARLFCPWNYPGQNTGMGSHSFLQGIFPSQGSNSGLPHCRQIPYHLSHQGSWLWNASVQFSSVTQLCSTFCNPMDRSMPGLPVHHHQFPAFIQTHVHWVDDAIQSSHPLSSPYPPAFNLSQCQDLFKWVSSSHQVAKVLEFQLQHQSFQWTFRLISFRMDWLDLLEVKGTLKSLLQHHSLKASILRCSTFFIVQLTHPYMTTGKTVALTRWTFVGKVISAFEYAI